MPALSNPRYELFAQEMAKGKTQAAAYIAAGFSPNGAAVSANKLLNRAKSGVRERINEILQKGRNTELIALERATQQAAVDQFWVLTRLKENVERAMQIEEVRDSEGKPTGVFKYDGAVANRALELLGKELGMFVEKHKVEHSLEHRLANMTEEQKREDIEDTINTIKRLVGRGPAPEPPTIDVEPEEPQGE